MTSQPEKSDSPPRFELSGAAKAILMPMVAEMATAFQASQGPLIRCKKCNRRHRRRARCQYTRRAAE